jgi:acetyl esterase/lipase
MTIKAIPLLYNKNMKITDEMIDHELLVMGKLNRAKLGFRNETSMRVVNSFCRRFFRGHSLTSKLHYEQHWVKKHEGEPIRVCVYRPLQPTGKPEAGLLWLHGGGYCTGVPESEFMVFENMIRKTNCVVVAPDYTLSIEKPFPAALDDSYRTLLWMNENAAMLGINPDWLMVGGVSAGGGLCASLSLLARDRQEVDLKFQMPLYPMLDYRPTPSSTDNNAPVWDSQCNIKGWDLYLGNKYPISKYACPALEYDYSGLPETLTYVGTIEPFYNETVNYVNNLKKAGVRVHFREFAGCYHAFDVYGLNAKVARAARRYRDEGFERAVNRIKKQYPLTEQIM